jgi:hypothetical protein
LRFTQARENEIVQMIKDDPTAHIRLPEQMYRPDGSVMIYRDNRQQTVHRHLWEVLNGRLLGRREYLLQVCGVDRCVNPTETHRRLSTSPHPGVLNSYCPNGHAYTPDNIMPPGSKFKCRKCAEARKQRRRKYDRDRRKAKREEAVYA